MDTTFTTIVSLLPYDLVESKPGLNPNEFRIAKAPKGGFSLNIIPNNVFYLVNTDPLADPKEVRQLKVPVPSIEVAQSIINDYVNALLGVELPDAVPGLFAVPGDHKNKAECMGAHSETFKAYKEYQNRWFQRLVMMADDSWSKNQMPSTISDLQRSAAEALGLERAWLSEALPETLTKCPMCKSVVNEGAVKCFTCQYVINKAEYDKLMAAAK